MKKKISERMMSTKQAVDQMNHYWKNLDHLASDDVKKKSMDKRFGIKDIKLDRYGNIISFNKYKRGIYDEVEEKKISSFGQFLEAKQQTAVFSFGRLNPPTTGHQKLLQKIIQTSKQQAGYACLYVSHSQDPKKNPLTAKQKVAYIKKMFPKEARQIEIKEDTGIRNAIDAATALHGYYENLVMVVGSDRVRDFKTLLNKYNGVESKHGYYKYNNIQIVSAGERDPDSEGVAGMSASKMRAAAASGDYESFSLGLPSDFVQGKGLFKDIRLGMNIREQLKPFKPIVEMNNMELIREQYFQNLIYNIGDWVKDVKTGVIGEVVKRGTNYVTLVQEDFTLHKVWLEDAQSMEKQHKKLPEAVNFLKNRNLWEKLQREGRRLAPERDDEWGTPELTKKIRKLTPGETVSEVSTKDAKDKIKKFASKFKIPMNVATAIWRKLATAGIDPLEIQKYSVLLTTYINLMDEKIPEVAPPGKEKMIKKLKGKYGAESDIPYKIAWAQHNKEKG